MDLDRERLLDAYRTMRMIRAFEEKLNELVTAGRWGASCTCTRARRRLPPASA